MTHQNRSSRRLRSGAACHPLPNIFQNEYYASILPEQVYRKITEVPTLDCDKINQLMFHPGSNHPMNLQEMKKALSHCSKAEENNDSISQNQMRDNHKFCEKNNQLFFEQQQLKSPRENEQPHQRIRKSSESVNGHSNSFGEEMMGNMNFLKELDQFLLE